MACCFDAVRDTGLFDTAVDALIAVFAQPDNHRSVIAQLRSPIVVVRLPLRHRAGTVSCNIVSAQWPTVVLSSKSSSD